MPVETHDGAGRAARAGGKRMKVSILTADASWGGAELHTVGLARTLAARGHAVSILQIGHDNYSQADFGSSSNITLSRLDISKPLPEIGWSECSRVVGSQKGDVCLFPKGFFIAGNWRLEVVARLSFSTFITIEHLCAEPMPPKTSTQHLNGLVPGFGLWWYRLLLQRLLRSVGPRHVIGVSGAVLKKLMEYYRFPVHKLKLVHNGIDPDKFYRNREWRARLRHAWEIDDQTLVFGALGRMFPQKGYDVAIRLFSRLRRSYPGRKMRLVLAGEGPLLDSLQALARENEVADSVVFAGFSDRPWEYYSAFDVFLMPSLNEGLPLALLEAMACECCSIAMGVGGIPEILTNEELGWLIPSGDEETFLEAMNQCVTSEPGMFTAMGLRARAHVVAHFDAENQLCRLARYIEEQTTESPDTEGAGLEISKFDKRQA